MYYVEIIHKDEKVAGSYQDLLSDSVDVANKLSFADCTVTIYECVKTLCSIDKISKVLSWQDDGYRT